MIIEFGFSIEYFITHLDNIYPSISSCIDRFLSQRERIKTFNDYELKNFYNSPESWKYDMDKFIIDSWHGSMLTLIISMLEKGLSEIAKIHRIDTSEKKIKYLKNKKLYKKSDGISYIIYQEIIKKTNNPKTCELLEIWKYLSEVITVRNHIIHKSGYVIDTNIYSKDEIIEIAKTIEDFLEILFYKGKSGNALDEVFEIINQETMNNYN